MAAFRAGLLTRALTKGKTPLISNIIFGTRAASGSSKGILPSSFPNTPEERAAAAKKYNIRPGDYTPYPDDGLGNGDYPMLPERSQQERDPWYEWDHPDLRRNWGEPMHYDFDMYTRNRVDTSPTPIDWNTMRKWLLGTLSVMLLLFAVGGIFPSYQPVAAKQYPYNNLYLERGGDPEKDPEPVKHYEI